MKHAKALFIMATGVLLASTATGQTAPIPRGPTTLPPQVDGKIASGTLALGPTVDATIAVNGGGSVKIDGFKCVAATDGNKQCKHAVSASAPVTLTATATNDTMFVGWAGACNGKAPTCTVPAVKSFSASATFLPDPAKAKTQLLTVVYWRNQSFNLFVHPDSAIGLTCDDPTMLSGKPEWQVRCTANVPTGKIVKMNATVNTIGGVVDKQLAKENWTGGCTGQWEYVCAVQMDQPRTVGLKYP